MKSNKKLLKDFLLVFFSSLIQVYAIETFVLPSSFVSSGFTGLAILINKITNLFGYNFSVALGILLLNLPAAFLCYRSISLKFTLKSILQIVLTSLMLSVLKFDPIFKDVILNCLIGGAIYGLCTVFAIKADASTGGTDFIALYIYNKTGKSIWSYVFAFNALIIIINGLFFGFESSGYSIVFQFVSIKTIEKFHRNFDQITLQITTFHPEELVQEYIKYYRHGITVTKSYGGYSKKELYLCHSVISNYELEDIVKLIRSVDPNAIINAFKTMNFYGGFYRDKIGEYKNKEEKTCGR